MTTNATPTDAAADPDETARAPAIVKNAASSYFSAVDLSAGTVLGEVGTGRYPHTALFHPDRPLAYLLYISSAHLEVLDLESLETVQRVEDLGTAPVGSTLGPTAAHLFVGTAVAVPGGEDPGVVAFAVDDDGRLRHAGSRERSRCSGMRIGPGGELYVAQKHQEAVVELTADGALEVRDRIPTGVSPHDMYVLAEDDLLVVNNSHESFATVIDTEANRVVAEPETGENPHGFAVADGPDYRVGVVPAREDDRVALVDLNAASHGATEPTEALLDVGTATGFAGVTPDGRYAIVDSYDEPFVTILDLVAGAVAGRVEVGGEPLHVVFGEDGRACYIGNMARSDIAVLDTAPLAEDRPGEVRVARRITGLGEKPSGIFRPEVDT